MYIVGFWLVEEVFLALYRKYNYNYQIKAEQIWIFFLGHFRNVSWTVCKCLMQTNSVILIFHPFSLLFRYLKKKSKLTLKKFYRTNQRSFPGFFRIRVTRVVTHSWMFRKTVKISYIKYVCMLNLSILR